MYQSVVLLRCDLTSSNYITPRTSPQSCSSSKGTAEHTSVVQSKRLVHAQGVLLTATDRELTTLMLASQPTEYLWWKSGPQSFLEALRSLPVLSPKNALSSPPPSSTAMADKIISRTVGSKQLQDDIASEDRDMPLRD